MAYVQWTALFRIIYLEKLLLEVREVSEICDKNTSQYSKPSHRNLQGNWSTGFGVYRGNIDRQTDVIEIYILMVWPWREQEQNVFH